MDYNSNNKKRIKYIFFEVHKFIEKPNFETAKTLFKDNLNFGIQEFLWEKHHIL